MPSFGLHQNQEILLQAECTEIHQFFFQSPTVLPALSADVFSFHLDGSQVQLPKAVGLCAIRNFRGILRNRFPARSHQAADDLPS